MWTYKRPYHHEELTKSYIENRGKLALSRALSIGRVVGFVGSGATMGYGQASWDGLVDEAHEEAKRLKENTSSGGAANTAIKRLKKLNDIGKLKDDHVHSLGLAERVAIETGKEDYFRDRIGAFFSKNRVEPQKEVSEGIERKAQPLRRIISDLRVTRLLTLNYDSEIEEEFYRMFRTSKAGDSSRPYGLELSDFEKLRGGSFEDAKGLPARVEHTDGTTRSVLSVSMNAHNIGELINFALQPMQYVGQVFHLHGRFDKPKDMVLTDADYRATYLKTDEQAQTFDEGLSALMSGNDILFIGIGMSEQDLLRPLRQFVSRDRSPEFSKRHVFAMREHTVSLDMEWLQESSRSYLTDIRDFADNHIRQYQDTGQTAEGAAYSDYAKDESEAVNQRTEYGVYSIFHGNQALRSVRLAVELLSAIQTKEGKPSPFKRKIDSHRYLAALEAMYEEIETHQTIAPEIIMSGIPETLLTRGEFKLISEALRSTYAALNRVVYGHEFHTSAFDNIAPPEDIIRKVKDLSYEARSRALDLALCDYGSAKDEWWAEWRKAPKSRNAQFRLTYANSDDEKYFPTAARHRPIYHALDEDAPQNFEMIKELQKLASQSSEAIRKCKFSRSVKALKGRHLAPFDSNNLAYFSSTGASGAARGGKQRSFNKVPPKRVVRASLPRGHGKGSLLHILQQPVPGSDETGQERLFIDTLFDSSEGSNLQGKRYFGSFFLHLSFSMEFASVISALKMFAEQATCGVIVEHGQRFREKAVSRLLPDDQTPPETFLGYLEKRFRDPVFCRKVDRYSGISSSEKRAAVNELVSEFYNDFWDIQALRKGSGREHRLEELRSRLSAFTDVVDILRDQNVRLAIVMSGLDKLCDSSGSAYNPMFRALFRMLSSNGAKTRSESDITTPLDLILINGQKDLPLRYLSHEYTKEQLKKKLVRPGETEPLSEYSSYAKYQPIGDDRYLEKWPVLPVLGVEERYWMKSPHQRFLKSMLIGDLESFWKPWKLSKIINRREIARLCRGSVAVHSWVAGAFDVLRTRKIVSHKHALRQLEPTSNEARKCVKDYISSSCHDAVHFINHMDAAAGRGEVAQIVREVMEIHKTELRIWGAGLRADIQNIQTPEAFRDWPPSDLRENVTPTEEQVLDSEANQLVDLVYLILSHLALFPMPVEPRVLYGCDEIYRMLAKICDAENLSTDFQRKIFPLDEAMKPILDAEGEPVTKTVIEVYKPYNWRDINRLVRLRLLSQVLKYLWQSSLVIAVRGKPPSPTKTSEDNSETIYHLNVGEKARTPDDIHTRYTIQHQFRDFTARLMDLSLPDQGERNFFQVSIYCDQPRDLPAPREDHYALVRSIMDRQIEQCRNSIWTLMKLTGDARLDKLQDSDRHLLRHGLTRRLLKLSDQPQEDGEPVIDSQLPSLHAVPQRIRALYGLLRSGFSIGTVSRLSALDDKEIDQPYERFRGWLRGVTNAATGWDYVLDELFFREEPHSREVDQTKTRETAENIGKILEELGGTENWPDKPEAFENFEGFARPLYRDEIGWLLNERGVVSLVQGQVFDAIPLFQRALDEMHHEDIGGSYDPALHAAVRRVRLNLATALIDRGHLGRAGSMLRDLQLPEDFSSHSGSQISWLARGYTGLIQHLSGNLDVALEIYDSTIERARDREMVRVVGIFSKHKADLLRRQGKFDLAREAVSSASNAALNCAQRDILHLTKISEGNLTLLDPAGSNSSAATCMIEALHFAQSMGIPRLESEARCLQASMMLAQGERMLAGSAAAEAAAIANRNGLRLNKLSALKHYGTSLRLRGQLILAKQVLVETRRESERRGYQSLAKRLADDLRLLD